MRWGSLRDRFKGVAWKRLTAHEVDPEVSNGHEFQGVGKLRTLLGDEVRNEIPTKYLLLSDEEERSQVIPSSASWYDARANKANRSPEWRLYYPKDAGAIQSRMRVGDLMVIALTEHDELAVMLAASGSSSETQLSVLFGIDLDQASPVTVRRFDSDVALGYVGATVLEEIGLGRPTPGGGGDGDTVALLAAQLLDRYPDSLPRGREVSGLIHQRITDVDPRSDPDEALARWIEAEAAVYRLWEDGLIERRLRAGFIDATGDVDVAAFREFSMRIRQSRISRAGGALQIHVAQILRARGVEFEEQVVTENGERPDFIFPSSIAYRDPRFPNEQLSMLATKFTLKDRWRQVLSEAARISKKHLLTMDPGITRSTLMAICATELIPVVPQQVRESYSANSRRLILNFSDFLRTIEP